MKPAKPKHAKRHSERMARELLRGGCTLKHEFRAEGHSEPYQYIFEWQRDGDAVYPTAYTTGRLPD
jgi:hypothetical protein